MQHAEQPGTRDGGQGLPQEVEGHAEADAALLLRAELVRVREGHHPGHAPEVPPAPRSRASDSRHTSEQAALKQREQSKDDTMPINKR